MAGGRKKYNKLSITKKHLLVAGNFATYNFIFKNVISAQKYHKYRKSNKDLKSPLQSSY